MRFVLVAGFFLAAVIVVALSLTALFFVAGVFLAAVIVAMLSFAAVFFLAAVFVAVLCFSSSSPWKCRMTAPATSPLQAARSAEATSGDTLVISISLSLGDGPRLREERAGMSPSPICSFVFPRSFPSLEQLMVERSSSSYAMKHGGGSLFKRSTDN